MTTAEHAPPVASSRRAFRQMALAAVMWGTIGPTAAIVQEHTSLDALQTSFWRLAIAAVPLAVVAILAGRATARPASPLLLLALAVGALTATSQFSYFAAIASSGIAIPTLIASGLGPVLTAVGQTLLFRARPDGRTLASLVVALTGLALLVLDGPREATAAGVLLAIVSAIAYAAAVLAAGPASRRMDVTALNAAAIAGGVLAMLPFILGSGGPGSPDSAIGWVALLHLGLIVSGLAYGLYYTAARTLSSTHLTIVTLLEPLVATVIAIALFGEAITLGVIVGGILMLTAVVGVRRPN